MPLDPDDGADSPALDAILRGPAAALTAVVLLVGEQARASGWAARAAVALARRWPGPRRPVLVDLDIERPSLHQLTGVENEEGVFDVVELGASVHRVTVPVDGERFELLPAGPFGGNGVAALLESPAWPRILYEAAGRRDTLLLYVPAESPGAAALLQRVGAVLVLAQGSETAAIMQRLPRRYSVLAALEPRAMADAAAAAPADAGTPVAAGAAGRVLAVVEESEPPLAEVRKRQDAARLIGRAHRERLPEPPPASLDWESGTVAAPVSVLPAAGEAVADAQLETAADELAPYITEPPVAPPVRRKKRRFPHPISWTIGVVLLLSLFAGSVHFLAGRFGRPAAVVTPEPPPPAPPPPPPPAPPPLPLDAMPYAVALEAHQNLATALERTDALVAAHADLSFFVAPLERNGVLHYHVMAGPVADSAAALGVRDTLLARRVKTTSTPSDIRYTPLALLIGDYSARDAAEQQIAELRRLDIPAYLVVGAAADSAPLYRVFVGGFSGPAEADVARQLLRAVGVRDHLVNRTRSSDR